MPARTFRPRAVADADAIWDFIAADNPRAADALLDRLDRALSMLAENPLAGRERAELAQDIRSFPVGNYVIFYTPTKDGIEVIRLLHGSRDVGPDNLE